MLLLDLLRKICPEAVKPPARKLFFYGKYMYYRFFGFAFAGKGRYYCPCCGLKFAGFTDLKFYGRPAWFNPLRYKTERQDVICPFCLSLPRHRILAAWYDQNLDGLKGKRILYFALENGMKRWFRRNGIPVISADLFHPADLKLDLDNIDQPDCSWDVVFCNHVLEHVPDFRQALKELRRILAPGGKLVCSFPIDPNYATVHEDTALVHDSSPEADRERLRKFGQIDHLRVFGLDSGQLLEEAGFTVTVIDGGAMPAGILPVTGPADYDSNILFVCVKR